MSKVKARTLAIIAQYIFLCHVGGSSSVASAFTLFLDDAQREVNSVALQLVSDNVVPNHYLIGLAIEEDAYQETINGRVSKIPAYGGGIICGRNYSFDERLTWNIQTEFGRMKYTQHSGLYDGPEPRQGQDYNFIDVREGLLFYPERSDSDRSFRVVMQVGIGLRDNFISSSHAEASGDETIPTTTVYPFLSAGLDF